MAEKSDSNYIFKFTWIIENFSLCPCDNSDDKIESPEFIVENMDQSKWYVRVRPRHMRDKSAMYCVLIRSESDLAKESIEVKFKIEVEDSKSNIVFSENRSENFKKGAASCTRNFSNVDILEYKPLVNNFLTVRCLMASDAYKNNNRAECTARTNICFDRTFFKWTLCGFECAKFSVSKQFYYFFQELMFEINIQTSSCTDDFKICIQKLSEFEDFGAFICRLAVLNKDGVEDISIQDIYCFTNNNQWELNNFLKKSVLKSNTLLQLNNDSFDLLCEFIISRKGYHSELDYNNYNALKFNQQFVKNTEKIKHSDTSLKLYHTGAVIEDLTAMLNDNAESDVILKIDNESFPAHKCILSARSAVFKAMFLQNMSEKTSGIVEVKDSDSKTIKAFLEYLYTGEILNTDTDLALKLLLVAEKYQVEPLKKLCVDFIIPAFTNQNVCEALFLGDMMNEETLKTAAKQYIKGHVADIVPSQQWLDLTKRNSELSVEVMCEVLTLSR